MCKKTFCVLGYTVEKKDAHSDMWLKVNDIPCVDTKFLVPDLIENNEYQFRVAAINAAGPSEPSQPTSLTKVKEKIGRYLRFRFSPLPHRHLLTPLQTEETQIRQLL